MCCNVHCFGTRIKSLRTRKKGEGEGKLRATAIKIQRLLSAKTEVESRGTTKMKESFAAFVACSSFMCLDIPHLCAYRAG